jgi:hypothetical protein
MPGSASRRETERQNIAAVRARRFKTTRFAPAFLRRYEIFSGAIFIHSIRDSSAKRKPPRRQFCGARARVETSRIDFFAQKISHLSMIATLGHAVSLDNT